MKTTYIKTIIFCLSLFSAGVVSSQQLDPIVITDYYQQELFINPAVTGVQNHTSATFGLKKQWLDIDKSPGIQRLQVHSPFAKNTMGMGFLFQHESYGVTNNFNFGLSYAYHIKLGYGKLSLGLKGHVVTMSENLRDVDLVDPDDPRFARNTGGLWGFNFGTGAYYSAEKFYVGLSLPRMFDNTLDQSDNFKLMNKFDLDQAPIYLSGGYVFHLQENIQWRLKPHLLLGYSPDYNWVYNVGVTMFFYDRCWVGVNLKYRSEFGYTSGVKLFDMLDISYSFTYGYGMPYAYRGLVHEIGLGVTFGRNKEKNKMWYF